MFASAAMVRNAVNAAQRENDPLVQAGRRWESVFRWIVIGHNHGQSMTFDSLVEDWIMNGFGREQAEMMIRKLIKERVLIEVANSAKGALKLDPNSDRLKWAMTCINTGTLPVLK